MSAYCTVIVFHKNCNIIILKVRFADVFKSHFGTLEDYNERLVEKRQWWEKFGGLQ